MEIYFETYGCTANYNSTEIMKGLVRQAGFNITANINYADLIIINSCIVKNPTEEKIRRKIQDLLKKDKKVILAGCMPRINQEKFFDENLFLLDTSHILDLIKLIHDIKNKNYYRERYLKPRKEIKLNLPKIPEEKIIGITQISEGCLGECTYCIVRFSKGKLFSYPKKEIIKSIKSDLSSRCKEIWITSQDNASYGLDNGKPSLPDLLKEILKNKQRFFVRVGMMNPNNVLKILPELIEVYKHPKMFKFLHIPIQAGSDKVLKNMKRHYKKKDILNIVREFKKAIPNIIISTDIIVGYPTETEKDFQETLDLIKKIKPEILNRSKFWPRHGTPAAKLKQLPKEIVRKRMGKLTKLHNEICNNLQKPWLEKEVKVLVDKKGFGNTYLARDENYKLFAVYSQEKILGNIIKIKVKKLTPHYLIGKIIK